LWNLKKATTRSEEKIIRSLSEPVFRDTGGEKIFSLLQSLYLFFGARTCLIIALWERATFGSHGGRVAHHFSADSLFHGFPMFSKSHKRYKK
jgi:hypothetical protein